ncbi:uncharacterized protein LOC113210570 [Frankliniella occidentalis]|uniref:Uncharacterized protein LOC113210570 n=1 Tax=Frankliniella occidentalis TaxID=133901 RepID=A0A6J1ST14_FRAOC|nr:uncharacterized protein LOC113210570 [Frankliniella occidentalis]XP_026284414.1 uncharacterized protein LOC113210570 [Frankliniella occidentalis]
MRRRLERVYLGEGGPRVHPTGLENTPSDATSAPGYSRQDPETQDLTQAVVSQSLNPRDWSQVDVLQWLRRVLPGPTPDEVFQWLRCPSGAVLSTLTKREIKERVGDPAGTLVYDEFCDELADGVGARAPPPSPDPTGTERPYLWPQNCGHKPGGQSQLNPTRL